MFEISLQRWLHQPIVINNDNLENLASKLSFSYQSPKILDHLPENLGIERALDILWSSLVFPELRGSKSDSTPIWIHNATLLSTHYANGIDLFSSEVSKMMDIADLNALFPSTLDKSIAKDVSICYEKLLRFGRSSNPLKTVSEEPLIAIYLKRWNQWSSNEDFFQILSLLPSIEGILTRAHVSYTLDTESVYVDPICAQAIWNTGLLDDNVDINSAQLHEELLCAVGSTIQEISTRSTQPSGVVIRALHTLFYEQIQHEMGRPWLWGHTTQ